MAITIRMHLTVPPSRVRWGQLMELADILATDNAYWYVSEVQQGWTPPCCLACAFPKVVYAAPPPGSVQDCQNFWSAAQVLKRRKANCIDASAYDVGVARGKGLPAYIDIEPVGAPMAGDDLYSTLDFHAVAIIEGVRVDSSAKLSAAAGCDCG